jgi:hypothetical protein
MANQRKLGEVLVQLRVLSSSDLERVLDALRCRQRRSKFGQVARDMGLLREEHIFAALAVQMRLFPGIERMTLRQILDNLQNEPTSA